METKMPQTGMMIIAMEDLGKHVYAGTVPHHVKERRRKANKAARISRRKNR